MALALSSAIIGVSSAQSLAAAAQECRGVGPQGAASFVEQCGDQLHAWRLMLPRTFDYGDAKDVAHGRFFFGCTMEIMCKYEPDIFGLFVSLQEWQRSSRDERTIFELADRLNYPLRRPPPMPPIACPLYDISLAGMNGRAVCFSDPVTGGSAVVAVVADDRVAFLLNFYQRDKSVDALKQEVSGLLGRFKIERATGDAALMKWFR